MGPGYLRSGRVQPIADGAALALAERRAETAVEFWGDAAQWRIAEASDGWCPTSPTGKVVIDTLSARLHPKQACLSLAWAIETRGGEILRKGVARGAVVWATGYQGLEQMTALHTRQVGNGARGRLPMSRFWQAPR